MCQKLRQSIEKIFVSNSNIYNKRRMKSQQCIMSQFDALIEKNRYIERSEYLMVKRYNDTLLNIENSLDAMHALKEELDEVKLKYSSASKSIENLKREIEKVNTDIKLVNKEIERFAVKDNSIKDEIMYQICSPTSNDLQTIFEKMSITDLSNIFKHSNDSSLPEESAHGNSLNVDSFDVDQWEQFRVEFANEI